MKQAVRLGNLDPRIFWKLEEKNPSASIQATQSLVSLIFQNNPNVPKELKTALGQKSLTCSDGLQRLISIRNRGAEDRKFRQEQEGCTLFAQEPSDAIHARKKIRTDRASMRAQRQEHEEMQIQVDDWECDVLIPVHPRDRLWIGCDPESVSHVLSYIRENAFSEHLLSHHNKAREGIWKRGDKFKIRFNSTNGEAKWQQFDSLEDASMHKNAG